jgi:hypothetical protein
MNFQRKKWRIILPPMRAPRNKKRPKTHPDKDKDAIPLKKAPILQPNAMLEP